MLKDYFLVLKILNNGIVGALWLPVGLSTFGQRILWASEMKILKNPGKLISQTWKLSNCTSFKAGH